MPSTVYSTPNKWALPVAWAVFTLSSMVAIISAARLPADGACWTWDCLGFMLPALALMFTSVHFLNALSGNSLMQYACAHSNETTDANIVTSVRELHTTLRDFHPTLANQKACLANIDKLLHNDCYELSRPVLRSQLLAFFDASQALYMVDELSRAERLLRRCWSALSDSYEAEAQAACTEATLIYANLLAKLPQD